jgi:bud site selection protein 31
MPPIRTSRNRKPPPAGFDDLEDTLLEFSNKMKDAENASHEGKKKYEVLWPIFQISHQRTLRPEEPSLSPLPLSPSDSSQKG